MPFAFDKSSCVAVGTFNIYILNPPWLGKKDILPKNATVRGLANLLQPGFRYEVEGMPQTWTVSPTRVEVESRSVGFSCGNLVAKLLRVLPETPVFGIGNNFHFTAKLDQIDEVADPVRGLLLAQSGSTVARACHFSVKRDDITIAHLQIRADDEHVEFSCNVHSNVEGRPDPNAEAVAAADRFIDDHLLSLDLGNQFFGLRLER